MHVLLRAVRGASIGVLAVYAIEYATRRGAFLALMDVHQGKTQKEGTIMKIFSAQTLSLNHLNPVKVSYEPKKIHTEAIQATIENIGKLSLEFEEELFYDPHGDPYFCFTAARGLDDLATEPAELYVRLGNWILPLRDELHVFSDIIFQHTFTVTNDFAPGGRGTWTVNTPMNVPAISMVGELRRNFKPNDPVRVKKTGATAIVTVVDVDRGEGLRRGVEILMDNGGEYYTMDELDIELVNFVSDSGEISGPSGTHVMPRVE
jgi:hypothetical protein